MNAPRADVQPRLLERCVEVRATSVRRAAEAWLSLAVADEHIEEREFDDAQRVRVERIIDRTTLTVEAGHRYGEVIRTWRASGGDPQGLSDALSSRVDEDLRTIVTELPVRGAAATLARYRDLLAPDGWLPVLCMADDGTQVDGLHRSLTDLGVPVDTDAALARWGIVRAWCPPEADLIESVAAQPRVCALADPATPIRRIDPHGVTTHMHDSRALLGVTAEMAGALGADVTLAVLDTGVDLSHPAFSRLRSGDYRNFTHDPDDDEEGHGTHVSSIAAGDESAVGGSYAGVAPRARLVVAKVLSNAGIGDLESVLRGMAWAVFDQQADVLSMSIGDEQTPPTGRSVWTRACDEAFGHGTIVCVAAGNTEPAYPETVMVPGDARQAITVGAIDKEGRLAPFSARGSLTPGAPLYGKPDCVAPGVGIVAALSSASDDPPVSSSDPLHAALSGTSMAAPAVAGCVALIKSKALAAGWTPTAAELRDVVLSTARPLRDESGEPYRADSEIGHGLVDVGAAFEAIAEGRGRVERARQPRRPAADAVQPTAAPEAVPRGGPADRPSRPAAGEAATFAADTCYACSKVYLSKVGTFSDPCRCDVCRAPICVPCWTIGRRLCDAHARSAASAPLPPAASAPSQASESIAHAKGETMTAPEAPQDVPRTHLNADPRLCDVFTSRFEQKVRAAREIQDPRTRRAFAVAEAEAVKTFRRDFGDVVQFDLTMRAMLIRRRLVLSAVCLGDGAFDGSPGGPVPAADVLRRIVAPSGLDVDGTSTHVVGVYSPAGWPVEWKRQPHQIESASFFLVEKAPDLTTRWDVHDKTAPLADLYNPEEEQERSNRVRTELAARLQVPGSYVFVDDVAGEQGVPVGVVLAVVEAMHPKWRILTHKGRTAAQRAAS